MLFHTDLLHHTHTAAALLPDTSSAEKRTSEKVSDEHSQIERSVDSKEFDETETVDETRRVDKAEESSQLETDQLRELFELVKTCRKEIAILTREKEQQKDVAMAAEMAVEIATEGQGQHEALAKGSTYDEVVDLGMEAETKTKTNLPSDDSYEELPKFNVAEDVELAQAVPEEVKGVKVMGSSTRGTKIDDKKKGRLKVTALPVLEAPANKHFDNFSFRFTAALGAIEGNWEEVLISGSGTEAEQQRLFSALTCVLRDDVALNLVRRHHLSSSKTKATDAWGSLMRTYAGNTPHSTQLLLRRMH